MRKLLGDISDLLHEFLRRHDDEAARPVGLRKLFLLQLLFQLEGVEGRKQVRECLAGACRRNDVCSYSLVIQ